jgi:hypothetical protein
MNEDELSRVRDAFAAGRVTLLRLLTDHSVYDCGDAAGISGEAWWGLENGHLITDHRAETLYPVLLKLQNGERLGEATPAETAGAPTESEDEGARQSRHEIALLVAAQGLMNLSSADLVYAAPTWDSPTVRETRSVARNVLRQRIIDLGGEPLAEEPR